MERVCLALFLALGSAAAQDPSATFAEGFSMGEGEDTMVIGYRSHTTASLMEFLTRGVLFDRLEVTPTEIRARTGEPLDLSRIRVTAFNARGRIVAGVPLEFQLEGPEDLLDLEAFRIDGTTVTAANPGEGKIWVESLPRARGGAIIRESIDLFVE